ncbi:uncharacterized protein ACNS7B_008807 [Menidia menidia]
MNGGTPDTGIHVDGTDSRETCTNKSLTTTLDTEPSGGTIRTSCLIDGGGEARLHRTEAPKSVAEALSTADPRTAVDPTWLDRKTAAKRSGGGLGKGQLVIVFWKYAGQTFRWLLENDVGLLVWLLFRFCQQGERNQLLEWQKEWLLEYAREFPPVTWHLDRRLKKAQSKKDRAPLTVPDLSQQDPNYASDAELLAAAESVLDESEASVSTQLTTWGDLVHPRDLGTRWHRAGGLAEVLGAAP